MCAVETIEVASAPVPDCVYTAYSDRSCGIRLLVDQWVGVGGDTATVTATYGPIENWDTSGVTLMSYLFDSWSLGKIGSGNRFQSFNENIAAWKTGKVTKMTHST